MKEGGSEERGGEDGGKWRGGDGTRGKRQHFTSCNRRSVMRAVIHHHSSVQ